MKGCYKIFIFALMILFFVPSICMANVVTKEQFNIGGVTLDSTTAYVKAIYGEPTRIVEHIAGPYGAGVSYYYGDSFHIKFTEPVPYTATDVYVTANNGISTLAGVHVGSDVMDVRKAYGQPKKITVNPQTHNDCYWYLLQGSKHDVLYFDFDENMVVKSFGFALLDGPAMSD